MKPGLWEYIVERDALWCWSHSEDWVHHKVSWRKWIVAHPVICVVPILDPANSVKCGGKQEVDHVKDEPMMGKRAPDDEFHLVAMCQEHNTWHPPSKLLRQAERRYLKSLRDESV